MNIFWEKDFAVTHHIKKSYPQPPKKQTAECHGELF